MESVNIKMCLTNFETGHHNGKETETKTAGDHFISSHIKFRDVHVIS